MVGLFAEDPQQIDPGMGLFLIASLPMTLVSCTW